MLLQLTDVNKIYNGTPLLKHISLTIEDRDRIGLIGVNGCGKSTLLKLITERILPDHMQEGDGEITRSSHTTIGYLEQMGGLEKEQTVWHEMHNVFQPLLDAQARMRELETELAFGSETAAEEYHRLQTYFEGNDGYQIDVKIKMVLNGMGFGADTYDRLISSFSGGEKTRLAIAKLLLEEPTLLILDEPTNHLDFKTVMWLEDYLKDYKGALLLVSHDRYFLNRLCASICEIEHGILTRYKGDYSAYTVQKEAAVARQMKEYELQQKEIAKLEDYIARNQTRASTAKSAQSRIKQLEKIERIEKPITYQKQARVQFTYEVEPPQQVLQVQDSAIAVGSGTERKVLAEPVTFEVRRGEKWGIIGENGVGKSTLLKILQGQLPHTGKIRWAAQTKISYFEQESTNLHPAKTVMQEIHDRVPTWLDYDVRSLLGKVRMTGEEVYKQVGVLSGGERAKVCFAVMMLDKANILILDEPTNHLDIAMKEVIEDAMKTFTGTILFVSHDRYLLDQVADHILEITPDGVKTYKGGFQSWLDATKKEEAAANAAVQTAAAEQKKEEKPTYRSKEQRAKAAQQRSRMRQLEQQSEEMQAELDALNEEITKEEVYSDFNLMQEKCKRMETLRTELDAALEEMILLEEEMA
ncbi:MAG: ABC-F type ribosomal protection protein [Oscillospiraceae bacterium]|nr:ABC-F type ribosomal protection protein [Oscillospiraceae bacterium]